jgi:hypothetical protein
MYSESVNPLLASKSSLHFSFLIAYNLMDDMSECMSLLLKKVWQSLDSVFRHLIASSVRKESDAICVWQHLAPESNRRPVEINTRCLKTVDNVKNLKFLFLHTAQLE